jgi:4-coumarate--CoA ligase
MVPPLMVFLAKNPLVNAYDLSSLKYLISGAAPLSKEVELAVMARYFMKTKTKKKMS